MRYFIQGKEVNKEEFDRELEKELENYKPISELWPTKAQMYKKLKEQRKLSFMVNGRWKDFAAVEEEIYDMAQVIEEAEFDTFYGDAIPIAVALYNAGYGKVK